MVKRTSLAIHAAAAVTGAAIPLYVLYYPLAVRGESLGFFYEVCGLSTFPAMWLLVHTLPDKYFYDYAWLTPPPNLGPEWVFILELMVMNALLWTATCFLLMSLVRFVRPPTVSGRI